MLRGTAWLDLSAGPVVLSVPDTGGRLYTLTLVDLWNDAFAVLGKRSTGTAKQHRAGAARLSGTLPSGMPRIDAPTTHVLARLLIQADGPAEYPAVHALQDGFVITPLSQWNLPPQARVRADGALNMKVSPREQVESLPTDALFAYASELLRGIRRTPPTSRAGPAARRGADPRPSLRLRQAGSSRQTRHAPGPAGRARACRPLPAPRCARPMAGSGKRAASACTAMPTCAARWPPRPSPAPACRRTWPRCCWPPTAGASRGRLAPLSPALRQRPVAAGRRLLVAGGLRRQGLLAPNALNRQALGSRDPLRYNEDGSLDLVLGHEAPAPEQQSNWLPLPASGPAQLLLRVYQPGPALLDGLWTPPLLLLEAPSEATAEVAPPPPSPATDADPTAAPARPAPIARPGRHGVLARQACGPGQGQPAAH